MCRGLAQVGVETWLFVFSPAHELERSSGVKFRKGRGGGLWQAWRDVAALINEAKPDLVHLHGLWMPVNHLAVRAARNRKIPYIIAPRGMLEPWSLQQRWLKKRLALWLYQRRDLRGAVALHATAESEAAQLRRLGYRQRIIISPNGVNLPEAMPPRSKRADGRRVILFLSRIHPKKGLLELVEAVGQVM
ncbi:MAG: glycosyltransferase, partial [Syntrophomonadaceae bacterium]|nr:glycosyltransferase [Syntrophomonadaceae bacterium]